MDLDIPFNNVSVLVEWLYIYNLQQCCLPYDTTHHHGMKIYIRTKLTSGCKYNANLVD